MMRKKFLFIAICTTLMCCSNPAGQLNNGSSDWHIVFKNDRQGNALIGDKDELIELARLGYPVRIGFGGRRASDTTKSVEHIVDCKFLTVANSEEVFCQAQTIIGQAPDLDTLAVRFNERLRWTIMAGTNGFSNRLMYDIVIDSAVGHRDLPTAVTWYVQYPGAGNSDRQPPKPLWN